MDRLIVCESLVRGYVCCYGVCVVHHRQLTAVCFVRRTVSLSAYLPVGPACGCTGQICYIACHEVSVAHGGRSMSAISVQLLWACKCILLLLAPQIGQRRAGGCIGVSASRIHCCTEIVVWYPLALLLLCPAVRQHLCGAACRTSVGGQGCQASLRGPCCNGLFWSISYLRRLSCCCSSALSLIDCSNYILFMLFGQAMLGQRHLWRMNPLQ